MNILLESISTTDALILYKYELDGPPEQVLEPHCPNGKTLPFS